MRYTVYRETQRRQCLLLDKTPSYVSMDNMIMCHMPAWSPVLFGSHSRLSRRCTKPKWDLKEFYGCGMRWWHSFECLFMEHLCQESPLRRVPYEKSANEKPYALTRGVFGLDRDWYKAAEREQQKVGWLNRWEVKCRAEGLGWPVTEWTSLEEKESQKVPKLWKFQSREKERCISTCLHWDGPNISAPQKPLKSQI